MAAMHNNSETQLQELVLAITSLAQSLELVHADIRRSLDDHARQQERLALQIADSVSALRDLPVSVADRIERIMSRPITPAFGVPIYQQQQAGDNGVTISIGKRLFSSILLRWILIGGGGAALVELARTILGHK
jgi:hypothetical protein